METEQLAAFKWLMRNDPQCKAYMQKYAAKLARPELDRVAKAVASQSREKAFGEFRGQLALLASFNGSSPRVLKAFEEANGHGAEGGGSLAHAALADALCDALIADKEADPESTGGPVYHYLAGLLDDPEALAEALRGAEVEQKALAESVGWLILKAFHPDQPRDDHGRWVSRDHLVAAAKDPAKAEELRAKVTDPTQRAKLEKVLAGESDITPTKAGAAKQASQQRQTDKAARLERVKQIRIKVGRLEHSIGDIKELADHLPHLSVAELRATRLALQSHGAGFGGARTRDAMANALLAHAHRIADDMDWAGGGPADTIRPLNMGGPGSGVDDFDREREESAEDLHNRRSAWLADKPNDMAAQATTAAARARLDAAKVGDAGPEQPAPLDVASREEWEGMETGAPPGSLSDRAGLEPPDARTATPADPAFVPADIPHVVGSDHYAGLTRDNLRRAALAQKLHTAGKLLPSEAQDFATGDGSRHVTAGRAEVVLTNRLGVPAAEAKKVIAGLKPVTTVTVGGGRKRPGYDVLDLFRAAGKLAEKNPESGNATGGPSQDVGRGANSSPPPTGRDDGRTSVVLPEVPRGAGGPEGAGLAGGDGRSPAGVGEGGLRTLGQQPRIPPAPGGPDAGGRGGVAAAERSGTGAGNGRPDQPVPVGAGTGDAGGRVGPRSAAQHAEDPTAHVPTGETPEQRRARTTAARGKHAAEQAAARAWGTTGALVKTPTKTGHPGVDQALLEQFAAPEKSLGKRALAAALQNIGIEHPLRVPKNKQFDDRQVAGHLVGAWAEAHKLGGGDESQTAGLERALEASGASKVGSAGQTVPFDGKVHQTQDGSVVTGQPVKVVRPGWTWQAKDGGTVGLLPARVEPDGAKNGTIAANSPPASTPEAPAVDTAALHARLTARDRKTKNSEVNALLRDVASLTDSQAADLLKKDGFPPGKDPKRQLAENIHERQGTKLRTGLMYRPGDPRRAEFDAIDDERLTSPDDHLGAKPAEKPKKATATPEKAPRGAKPKADPPATDAGRAVAGIYDRAAGASDADVEAAKGHLANMTPGERSRVASAMGYTIPNPTAAAILQRITDRRGAAIRSNLIHRPTSPPPAGPLTPASIAAAQSAERASSGPTSTPGTPEQTAANQARILASYHERLDRLPTTPEVRARLKAEISTAPIPRRASLFNAAVNRYGADNSGKSPVNTSTHVDNTPATPDTTSAGTQTAAPTTEGKPMNETEDYALINPKWVGQQRAIAAVMADPEQRAAKNRELDEAQVTHERTLSALGRGGFIRNRFPFTSKAGKRIDGGAGWARKDPATGRWVNYTSAEAVAHLREGGGA